MEQDTRIVYHLIDGSIIEIVGSYIVGEYHDEQSDRYELAEGPTFEIYKNAIAYSVIDDASDCQDVRRHHGFIKIDG